MRACCRPLGQRLGVELLAHPLTQPYHLPLSPIATAGTVVGIVLLVLFAWPQPIRTARRPPRPTASWEGRLSRSQTVGRVVAIVLLGLAVVAGRVGVDDELENLAPALVVGAAWPLLFLTSACAGPVWRWLDPWDGLARLDTRAGRDEPRDDVWPACLVALPWMWYLAAYRDPLAPRAVGAILALYTLFTLSACFVAGRRRWLSSGEPLGILLGWTALLPRRRLGDWDPPAGAGALLGVVAGGVLFAAARRSELWGSLNTASNAERLAALGLLASCAAGAGALTIAARLQQRRVDAAVARAAVPAVAAIVVAVGMDRNRLSTSVQLLPGLLGDPLGRGWDLLGPALDGLDPAPLGIRGLILAQLGVVLVGHLAGAVVVAMQTRHRARDPAAACLAVLAGSAVIAIASH